ncbi:FMRFamide receptor [Plakobranchus ocellatus]|uniref:FMRFamide receptor n=1 Tax=Plakobranchus ocellatus TaxID=259542 RepID=A0AAV4AF50_9GAST|nr:FMRFamide receptor [Plakobranchus ocellatus]
MTEFFTMAPYSCGAHDPTTDYYSIQREEMEDMSFHCAMRNVYGVVLTLIGLLGIVGNVFCLVILPKTGGSKSAIVMLVTLGVYDTLFLASGIFLKYLPSITFLGHSPVVVSNLLSPVMFPVTLLSHLGAAYTTVAISGERCIAITTPLKVTQWLTTRRVKSVDITHKFNAIKLIELSEISKSQQSIAVDKTMR